ncbi:MAG: matrixin family metalloprotease [Planctomycetia bacterium]|nr:matrixin family metalloprotease [Planctomycetia bacterium]
MAISAQVLKQLKDFWKSRVGADALPDDKAAAEAIEKVVRLLDVPLGQAIDFPRAIAAISAFQRLASVSGNEGVLTKGLVDRIKRLFVMDDNTATSTNKKLRERVDDRTDKEAFWIRYFVDTGSLGSFSGPQTLRRLCAEAWDLWLEVTEFLFVREVDQPGPGVVVVKSGVVAGSGVGEAPVLGPGSFNRSDMTVKLEIREINESDAVFRAIAAHEFGHIIGIGHLGQSGNLMSVTVHPGITALTKPDVDAAQRIYGAPPTTPTPLDPGSFPVPNPM